MNLQPVPVGGLSAAPSLHAAAQAQAARKGGVRIVDVVKMYGVQGAGVLAVDH